MHSRRSLLSLSGAALAGGLAGCLENLPGAGPPMEANVVAADVDRSAATVSADDREALVAGNSAFGLALHDQLVEASPDANLLTSPLSISVALAMTYAGAEGTTAEGMADAMRFRLPEGRLHRAVNDLDGRLAAADGEAETTDTNGDGTPDGTPFALRTANSLWGQEGFPFDEGFLATLARNYGTGMRTLDFTADPEAARETINHWVAGETEGTIEELLPEDLVTELTRLVVANAVYFRASWRAPFDEDDTEDGTFTALDGTTSTVPVMHQDGEFPHAEVDGTQVLELPYAGGDVGMVLLVPPEGEFRAFERSLSAAALHDLFAALETTHGDVALPRFTYGSKARLRDSLSALGMETAFASGEADFTGMTDPGSAGEGLYLRDVVHETHVAVDEAGTEASAATGAVVAYVSHREPQFEFAADRPFVYAIRHRPTDAVLFLGRVVDAGAAQG